jgi:hypothetical protein
MHFVVEVPFFHEQVRPLAHFVSRTLEGARNEQDRLRVPKVRRAASMTSVTRTSIAEQLSSWAIDLDATRALARVMGRNTNRALADAITSSLGHLRISLGNTDRISNYLAQLESAKKVVRRSQWSQPLHVWLGLYTYPERFLSPGEIEDALLSLDNPTLDERPPRVAFDANRTNPRWVDPALAVLRADLTGDGITTGPFNLTRKPLAPLVQVANEAIGLLETTWPEAALEMHELVRQIVFFDGPESNSASTIHTFGAIYLTAAPEMVNVPAMYEALLHEGGHHALTLKESFSTMLLNSEERTESPLRGAARPVRGVFHAVFVLMRMILGIERALAHVDRGEREKLEQRAEFLRIRREVGFRSLERSARFTDHGAELFDAMCRASR